MAVLRHLSDSVPRTMYDIEASKATDDATQL